MMLLQWLVFGLTCQTHAGLLATQADCGHKNNSTALVNITDLETKMHRHSQYNGAQKAFKHH